MNWAFGPCRWCNMDQFASAILTVAFAARFQSGRLTGGHVIFSYLEYRAEPTLASDPGKGFEYLTPSGPRSLRNSEFKVLCTRSILTVAQAGAVAAGLPYLTDPRAPIGSPALDCPGEWDARHLLADMEEVPILGCLPGLRDPRCRWIREWYGDDAKLRAFLDNDLALTEAAVQEVRTLLGVNLNEHADQLAGMVVVWPVREARITSYRSSGTRWSFDTVGSAFKQKAITTIRGLVDDRTVVALTVSFGEGSQVVELGEVVDRVEFEVFDGSTGGLIYRAVPRFIESVVFTTRLVDTRAQMSFTVVDEHGQQLPGSPVEIETEWGMDHTSSVGAPTPESRIAAKHRQAGVANRLQQMRTRRELLVIRPENGLPFGSDLERKWQREVADIIHRHGTGYLKVWDLYFGPVEALRYLMQLFDPSIPIQVITSEKAFEHAIKESFASLFARVSAAHTRVRVPTAVEMRRGNDRHHDRFLITAERCWQFGTSFNSVGKSYSTIVELPNKLEIEAMFDEAWTNAGRW